MKSIDHLPAVQWGNYCEPFVIKDFERDHPGKITMTGLHISKEHPNLGNFSFFSQEVTNHNIGVREGTSYHLPACEF